MATGQWACTALRRRPYTTRAATFATLALLLLASVRLQPQNGAAPERSVGDGLVAQRPARPTRVGIGNQNLGHASMSAAPKAPHGTGTHARGSMRFCTARRAQGRGLLARAAVPTPQQHAVCGLFVGQMACLVSPAACPHKPWAPTPLGPLTSEPQRAPGTHLLWPLSPCSAAALWRPRLALARTRFVQNTADFSNAPCHPLRTPLPPPPPPHTHTPRALSQTQRVLPSC